MGENGKAARQASSFRKDGRKRIAFILLFIGLLAGSGFLLVTRPWQISRPIAISGNKGQQDIPVTPDSENDKDNSRKSAPKNSSDNDQSSGENKVVIAKEKDERTKAEQNNPANRISSTKIGATTPQPDKQDPFTIRKNDPVEEKNKNLPVINAPVLKAANARLSDPVKDRELVLKENKAEKTFHRTGRKQDGTVT